MSVDHILRHICLDGIPPIMDRILPLLMACEVASLLCALGIRSMFRHKNKYLNPLRDLDPSMEFLGPMIKKGHTILMLGDSTERVIQRILEPEKYWKSHRWDNEYDPGMWVIAIPPDAVNIINRANVELLRYNINQDSTSWYKFRDIIVRDLLKQIWIDDNAIGYVGEEEDWSSVCHCTSHDTVRYKEPTQVSVVNVVPDVISHYAEHNITINDIRFYADWESAYLNTMLNGVSSMLPYIHINQDPLKVVYATNLPSSDDLSKVYMILHSEYSKDVYIPIF